MSENTEQVSGPHSTISQAMIYEMLTKNFDKLPSDDQNIFKYGSMYLAGNAGLAGLVANSLFRRILNVREARITSSMPMAFLPFLATSALFDVMISTPLLSGNLDCPSCAMTRGALIGLLGGGLYPIALALPINLGLAARYSSAPLPEMGSVLLRYCRDICRPVLKKMGAALLLQAFFGAYLGNRQFLAYTNLVHITFSKEEVVHKEAEQN